MYEDCFSSKEIRKRKEQLIRDWTPEPRTDKDADFWGMKTPERQRALFRHIDSLLSPSNSLLILGNIAVLVIKYKSKTDWGRDSNFIKDTLTKSPIWTTLVSGRQDARKTGEVLIFQLKPIEAKS